MSCGLHRDLHGAPVCEARPRLWDGRPAGRYPLWPGLGLGAGQAPGSSPGPEAGRWVLGKVESKSGRRAGCPSLPSSSINVRPLLLAAPGPRPPGSCSEAALADPRPMHPSTSSPLCFPSGEFFPPPSFLAVSWPSRSFLVTGQAGDTPQNRRLGAPRCQAGVGGLARLTLRAWRVRPSRGRPAASPPLPARLRPEASAGTDRTVFYNVSSSPAFLRGRAQPLRGSVGASRNHVLWEPNSFSFPTPNF